MLLRRMESTTQLDHRLYNMFLVHMRSTDGVTHLDINHNQLLRHSCTYIMYIYQAYSQLYFSPIYTWGTALNVLKAIGYNLEDSYIL